MEKHETVLAETLPREAIGKILDMLLERLDLEIAKEETPDYTVYRLRPNLTPPTERKP